MSPDDRWVAYVSNDAGHNEVYVRPFPTGDGSAIRFNYIAYHQAFDVMPDGRFAFIDQPGQNESSAVRLVEVDNWFADLRAKRNQ